MLHLSKRRSKAASGICKTLDIFSTLNYDLRHIHSSKQNCQVLYHDILGPYNKLLTQGSRNLTPRISNSNAHRARILEKIWCKPMGQPLPSSWNVASLITGLGKLRKKRIYTYIKSKWDAYITISDVDNASDKQKDTVTIFVPTRMYTAILDNAKSISMNSHSAKQTAWDELPSCSGV